MYFRDRIIKKEELLWNKRMEDIPVIFWGCGNNASIVKDALKEKGIVPVAYCDNNVKLVGKSIEGIPVMSYKEITEKYKRYMLILTMAINNATSVLEQLANEKEENLICHMEKSFKCDDGFLEYSDFENHVNDYEMIYEMLQDAHSKEVYISSLNFKLSGNKLPLLRYADGDTFFDEDIIPLKDNYSYVDVGAYTGDTILRFYAFCRGKYDKIYALEPDKGNFDAMKNLVEYGRLNNVILFNLGGWNKKTELTFYTVDNNNEKHFESPNFFKSMEKTMPNSMDIDKTMFIQEKIEVDTVDNLLQGEKCDIIKINALAADFQVLEGSKKTIERYKPIIVGEFGTQKEHLLDMIRYIKEIEPTYKIYFRQKMIFGDCKTIYIATV